MNKEMYSNSYDFLYLLHLWLKCYYIYGSGFYYIYGWLLFHAWLVLLLWLIITFTGDTASQLGAGD